MPEDLKKPINTSTVFTSLLETDKLVTVRRAQDENDPTKRVGLTPPAVLGDYLAERFGAGGAPQWVAGAQTLGALVYDAGKVYRVKANIANSQVAPGSNPANYEPVGDGAGPWRYVGDVSDLNIQIGSFGPNTVFLGSYRRNAFGSEHYGDCTYGSNLYGNYFGSGHSDNVYGQSFSNNVVGDEFYFAQIAQNVSYCEFGANIANLTIGQGCTNLTVGNNCSAITFGAGCENVEVYNCDGLSIPGGTTNAVYRNNEREDFQPITANQYGDHPAFASQNELNAFLLGGTYTPPEPGPESVTITSVTPS